MHAAWFSATYQVAGEEETDGSESEVDYSDQAKRRQTISSACRARKEISTRTNEEDEHNSSDLVGSLRFAISIARISDSAASISHFYC